MSGNGHAKLRFIDPVCYQDKPIPEREWLVPNWIPFLTVTGLYGDGGVGKSLLAQQLMTAAAIGKPWIGLPVQRVKVLGIFCEDDESELQRRQADINTHYGCDFADLEDMRWIPRFGEDNILMDFSANGHAEPTIFHREVLEMAMDFGAQAVIIDTVADTFGGNENDRGQVRQFVQQALGTLARKINGAAIALAHPSRLGLSQGTGESGSTGWSNSFRSRAYLSTPKDEEDAFKRTLQRKKANYANRDETIELRWNAGVFLRDDANDGILGAIKRRSAENVFLDQLNAIIREGRHVSDNPRSGNFAPTIFAGRPDRQGLGTTEFRRAMEALFASKQIKLSQYTGSNRSTNYTEIVPT